MQKSQIPQNATQQVYAPNTLLRIGLQFLPVLVYTLLPDPHSIYMKAVKEFH